MPRPRINRVLERLPAGRDAPTDGYLLGKFIRERDEGSFVELVRRHGPMVLGACRRVTGHAQDAEDAFQAVFLVLARKAASVSPRDAVGGWLHGVALRTAMKARDRAARRRRVERQEVPMDTPAPDPPGDDPELARLLDEEIDRLPEALRVPVVLCELEGRPRAEVARRLGIPEGTLSSRLATARKRLAARLSRRGMTLPAVGAGVNVVVPAGLTEAAVGVVRGFGSKAVLSLADGVVKAMFLQKLKQIGIAGLAVVLAGGVWGTAGGNEPGIGTAAVTQPIQPVAATPEPPPTAPPPRAAVPDPVQAAFEKLVEADKDWRAADAAQKELAELGEKALDVVIRGAESHAKERVRFACFRILIDTFPKDERSHKVLTNHGLSDASQNIRYLCAFWLGEHKVFAAHRRLRIVTEDGKNDELTRLAAAKSLAQFGEADVLRTLYGGLESDWYMHRHLAHLGVKALTGKSPDDFGGYQYAEGTTVLGGREVITQFDAITRAEKKVKRHQAILAFCTWLKKERPDLYKHLTGTF